MKELITKFAITYGTPKPVETEAQTNLDDSITNILNWILGLIGVVCVIVMIIGGVQYMTSTGDPGKVKKAKDTIMYAIIGLIVVILAAAIVNFVVAQFIK